MTSSAPDRGNGSRRPAREPGFGLVIARPFGIPVYLSPGWLIFAVLLVVMYATSVEQGIGKTSDRYLVATAFVVLLYASVLVHELAHCVVARWFHLPVRRVLLYPLGGYSEIEQEAATPGREAAMSAAGPIVSLGLAGIGYELAKVTPPGLPHAVIAQLYIANLFVGVFNLLPGLPLDGGRIFRAGVWKLTGKQHSATIAAAWAGRVLAIAMALFALVNERSSASSFSWLWLIVIAVFIWFQSTQAIKAAKIRERLPSVSARRLVRRAIPVQANLPLAEAIRRADAVGARALVIVDHEGTPTAIVNETAVRAIPDERRPWIEAGSVARTLDPGLVLPADLAGMDLINAVRKTPASEYLLIESTGQVYGVLAAADLDLAFAGA